MTIEELNGIFKSKKQRLDKRTGKILPGFVDVTFASFCGWYDKGIFDRGCFYCGTTCDQSLALYNLRPKSTRGGKRGRRLELDRKNPLVPYDDLSNLVWCCYWCNNAKSNFFTADEFSKIGTAIGLTLAKIGNFVPSQDNTLQNF